MSNTVEIRIYADPANPAPTLSLPDVPWYAGITVLQAMILGEAMHTSNFTFRVEYRSIYGAQIDAIDGVADEDASSRYWMLWIDGAESKVGASEAILLEDATKTSALVECATRISAQQPRAPAARSFKRCSAIRYLFQMPCPIPLRSPAAEERGRQQDAATGVLEARRTLIPCPLGRFRDREAPAVHHEARRKRVGPKGIGDAG